MRWTAALAGAWLSIAPCAAAEPLPELRLLQDGQGLSAQTADVAVSPDGRHVYGTGASFVVALRRRADGRLDFVEEYLLSVPGTRIAAPSDGLGVLAIAQSGAAAAVVSYQRDPGDGRLTWVENEAANLSGSAFALAPSGDGTRVYVTSPGQDGVVAYARDAATGALSFAQRVRDADAGVSGLVDPSYLAVSPDDADVYVAAFLPVGQEVHETIALLRRQADDSLLFVESVEVGELSADTVGLSGLLVAPDGGEVLALDGGSLANGGAAVVRYARDPADGRLAFAGVEPLVAPGFFGGFASWFAPRPDGARLFFSGISTSAPTGGTTMAWSRDEAGALAPLARADGSWGLFGSGVASPDGHYVYASPALGARVFAPEPGAGAAGLAAALGLVLRRPARRARQRARASARA